jgi:nitroimidazol reductase NimA-like FMN-containing flavoprotein (pyridoxamine 5'-phosphate oxidase superfamily)
MAAFLNGPWTARLACIRPDGGPHVIPVWQEWDGERFVIIAWQGSQWAEYVLQNPNVSISVDEPWPPLRRVVARGKAVQMPADSSRLDEILLRLSGRYLGQGTTGITGQVHIAFSILPDYLRGWQGLPGTLISV